jgi:hypothetical protein
MANASGPGLLDERFRVEHFGSGKSDIAWVGNLNTGDWPTLVLSGALLRFLEANGVKGFVPFRKDPEIECVFSRKGEPTLAPQPRTFNGPVETLNTGKPDIARLMEARRLTASLRDLPWDCSSDGLVYFHLSTPQFVVLDPMTGEEDDQGPYKVRAFKGPGVYALPVAAIRRGRGRGVAVDSATLVFVDNAFYPEFRERYEWDKAITKRGGFRVSYHEELAEEAGTRFGVCSTPPTKFKSDFDGDGYWTIDVKAIRRVQP